MYLFQLFLGFYHWFIVYYNSRLLAGDARSANTIKVVVGKGKDWCYYGWLVVEVFKVVRLVKVGKLFITYNWIIVIIWFRLFGVAIYFCMVIDIIKLLILERSFDTLIILTLLACPNLLCQTFIILFLMTKWIG